LCCIAVVADQGEDDLVDRVVGAAAREFAIGAGERLAEFRALGGLVAHVAEHGRKRRVGAPLEFSRRSVAALSDGRPRADDDGEHADADQTEQVDFRQRVAARARSAQRAERDEHDHADEVERAPEVRTEAHRVSNRRRPPRHESRKSDKAGTSTRLPRLCAVASDSFVAATLADRARDSHRRFVKLADIVYQFL
jgi:hypothetical protein